LTAEMSSASLTLSATSTLPRRRKFSTRPKLGEPVETLIGERAIGHLELSLDVGLGRVRADVGGVALGAEQETDRLREDRLARTRLTRDRVQPGREVELGTADQDEVLDRQAA